MESGSGPGALPGAPLGSPLDSAAENFGVLNAVEMPGFHSYKFDYSCHPRDCASLILH